MEDLTVQKYFASCRASPSSVLVGLMSEREDFITKAFLEKKYPGSFFVPSYGMS